jgi:hypothetical protein
VIEMHNLLTETVAIPDGKTGVPQLPRRKTRRRTVTITVGRAIGWPPIGN